MSTVFALLAFMKARVLHHACRKARTACGRFSITSSRAKKTGVMKWSTKGVAVVITRHSLGFLQCEAAFERGDVTVDLVGLHRRAGGLHAADRHDVDASRAPALDHVDSLTDPVGQRADGGDADALTLEIVDRLDR